MYTRLEFFAMRVILTGLLGLCFHLNLAQAKYEINEDLYVSELSRGVLVHVSKLNSQDFGPVWCNGMIYINKDEAVVMDTPPNVKLSEDLLAWFEKQYPSVKISYIVVTHFHDDCLGGLESFHKRGIASVSHELTPKLLDEKEIESARPKITIRDNHELKVGEEKVVLRYFGEGHTRDNIIAWLPSENAMFGGCLLKEVNAGKGNLADANVKAWPRTIGKIQETYPEIKLVVPGHGKWGGNDLLSYTRQLFEQ